MRAVANRLVEPVACLLRITAHTYPRHALVASFAACCPAWAMDEVIVSAVRGESAESAASVFVIDTDDMANTRAVSLSDALAYVPSASLQTNSRGETLVYLRGAGERQTALYFDGASLNIPWDNRLDISLLPARTVSQISATPGVSSVLYGANASGGVIEVIPLSADAPVSFDLQGGEGGFVDGGATLAKGFDQWQGVLSGGASRQNGAPLPQHAGALFSQDDGALRTNTDYLRYNGLARIETGIGDTARLSASLLAIDAEYGIAPEAHLDPEDNGVRFWRYPESRHIAGILNASSDLPGDSSLRAAFWVQQFNQTIESYASSRYSQINDVQRDSDRTYGARAIAAHRLGAHAFRGVITFIDARHNQTDIAYENGAAPIVTPAADQFRARTVSLGGEYDFSANGLQLSLGASGDFLKSLETGGRANAGDFSTWNLIGGAQKELNSRWSIAFSAGRKTRLPTQRELYGAAINRFLLNPDLQAESSVLIEAPLRFDDARLSFSVVPFANFTSNTIDQKNVTIDGTRLRQRINLNGSRGFGVEVFGDASITDRLKASGNISALHLRQLKEDGAQTDRYISERPALLASASLSYSHPGGWRSTAELQHRGRAFSLNENNVFVPLERSTSFNLETAYSFSVEKNAIDIFLRADNITDTLIESQLGLPGAGRLIRAGVRVSMQ